MRVLVVDLEHPSYVGGRQTYSATLAKYLLLRGVELNILSGSGVASEDPTVLGLKRHIKLIEPNAREIESRGFFRAWIELACEYLQCELESNAVDLIHAHGVVDVQVAIKASLGSTVPIILTIHSPPPDEEEEFLEALVTSSERVTILVLSQYMKNWCRSKGLNCQIEVIPGLVDFEVFAPEFLPKPKDGGYLLCPARPVPRKGFEIIFEALGSLRRRDAEVPKLRVGGSGTVKELLLPHTKTATTRHVQELIRLMDSQGIEEHVVGLDGESRPFFNSITIKHDRLPRIYQGSIATLYVPIREPFEEPFGLCVIEAMRMESLVIATSVGGIREIIDHGITGILIPPGNPSELRKAIELVLSDQRLRKQITRAAAKEVRKYEASEVVDQIIRFYQRVTTGNLRARA